MFNGDVLRDALLSAANNIANHKKQVDDLNVFPVPDGDTGTNMSMTIANSAREMEKLSGEPASKVASVNSSALLRGARGNSGVITSLLFRGFSKGIKDEEYVTPENLAAAFKLGVKAAYKAVMKPTEGTILTVARVASEYAEAAFNEGKDALGVFESALEGAKKALAETPEQLPVLKKAGVVDAGGQGFVIILEGMLSVFRDGVIIEDNQAAAVEGAQAENAEAAAENEISYAYAAEFTVNCDANSNNAGELREYLDSLGSCKEFVEKENTVKVQLLTDHPGDAIEKAITFGQLVNIKIDNMQENSAELAKSKPAKNSDRTEVIKPVEITQPVGFVSVCAGEGLADLFRDLGVDTVVSGGQTMNPSTDDILRAIESTPAETVIVLPNNKNIIMAAEQAIPISTRKVIVLHTRTIPQGITAMLSYDPESEIEANAIEMQNAAGRISTGQITFAARDSDFDGHKIKEGELLALNNGKISFVDTDLEHTAVKLAKQMITRDSEFVTIIFGEGVTEEEAAAVEAQLNEKYAGKIEITVVNGGQPVYYYIISVE